MASYTPNLNLLMKDPVADGADTFNIETMLNENWEKIDRQVLRAMAAAAAYDAGKTYQQGDFCTQGGLLYRASQAIAQPEAWTAGHWTAISITDVIRGLTAANVGAVSTTEKGTAGGVATLDDGGKIPYQQIPHVGSELTLYVNASAGNDGNPGTSQAPFKTIQAAIDSVPKLLQGTVTINIAAGTYEENVDVSGFAGGEILLAGINLTGAGQNQTFVKGLVVFRASIPIRVSSLHISKGNPTGMCGTYMNTVIFDAVTFDGADAAMGSGLPQLLTVYGGMTFLSNCTFQNAPLYAILCCGFLSCSNLQGQNNAVGIRTGMSPGYLAAVVTNAIPSGFAATKYEQHYGKSMIYEDGALV